MPAFEWVHVQLHQQKGMISLSPPTICNSAVIKFRREGTEVEIKGMNDATRTLVDRFGVHDKPEEVEKLMGGH
ncbi:putative sulfate permease [Klebsiella pneumoniae]|nr:putative sulfate permease [Klebsiella pneumoniae]VAT79182.1 putative sulfate permease [Klebsiella pneumoniae]